MARMMERIGQLGVAAIARGEGERMARIYWHSVEFGLSREDGEVKIFGAGLASSFGEFGKALERRRASSSASSRSRPPPRRRYENDHMQPLYFINDGVEAVAGEIDGLSRLRRR